MSIARLQISLAAVVAALLWGGFAAAQQLEPKNPGFAFVTKYCLACHSADEPEGKLDLSRFSDTSAMLSARGVWAKVVRNVRNGEMPPRDADQPTQADRDAFVSAVQKVFRQADANRPVDPGRVVVRRLNRTEYNNTVRDLCLIEFEPAENFPADEASHGFDNQSESLSLSPLLLERYLDAADAVVTRALSSVDLKTPTVRTGFAQFIVDGSRMPYRVSLFTSEPLTARFRLAADGDYVARLEGKPIGKGKQSIEAELLVDDRPVERLVFVIPEKGDTTKFAIPLKLVKGLRRVSVRLLDPAPELEARKGAHPPRVDGKNDENSSGLDLYRIDIVGPTDEVRESRRNILACNSTAQPPQQAREILERFARRAFRRPVEAEEVTRYVDLFERSLAAGKDFDAAIAISLQAILVSPGFLFRAELDDRPQAKAPHPISEFHLASRLSYFLWSSMPDEKLFDLAARGELSKNLDAQVRRMLADDKSQALVDNFTPQWLGITGIHTVTRGGQDRFDQRMRDAMTRETLLFFEAVLRENRPVTDFLDGRYTFVNDRLAGHYQLGQHSGAKNPDLVIPAHAFIRVPLPVDGLRAGIFTHASVLTMTSPPDRTSPVKRGGWILENLLASPPPPPPPNVPALEKVVAENPQAKVSLRQRLEQHRGSARCAGCHSKIDPLGFALEKFDNIGRQRTKDETGQLVDDLGELPGGRKVAGVAGLREVLLERKDEFARCLTEKLLTYALGRSSEEHDIPTVEAIVDAVRKDDYRMQNLIFELVKSEPFRMRRASEGEKP
jgi:hypothetical protein